MKIQKDMNRYKFQMGAELPPEIMQQMQGMPMEQGIPMEQGMPVEQGNGEASFAQQLMAIEQEIDKIQKEMKKLEKRNDRLAQNEYKRLEQQLMQLEQQKEMLRQQVEATRQQLEAQEQMQGEEYLDPNAQYEMSPEELNALEGQYQDVPMDEQLNPEEMQMMRCGGKMQTGEKVRSWVEKINKKIQDFTSTPVFGEIDTEKLNQSIQSWKDYFDTDGKFYNPTVMLHPVEIIAQKPSSTPIMDWYEQQALREQELERQKINRQLEKQKQLMGPFYYGIGPFHRGAIDQDYKTIKKINKMYGLNGQDLWDMGYRTNLFF